MNNHPIIDVWMQHPTQRFSAHPMFDSLRKWTKTTKLETELPIHMTISAMDASQVKLGLICSWQSPNGALISNKEVANWVTQHPNRLVGIASVNLHQPVAAIRELRHYVKEQNFKGLRVVQWLWNLPPTHAYYYPLFAECVELGVPICLQVGHTGPLRPSEVGRPIPYIDQIALDFPELKIVCGHIGYPWTIEMIAVATKHENVYIDTSAYSANRYPDELVNYMKKHGKTKVLFGTNYPMLFPKKCLDSLPDLELGEEVEQRFLYKNAIEVFGLEKYFKN